MWVKLWPQQHCYCRLCLQNSIRSIQQFNHWVFLLYYLDLMIADYLHTATCLKSESYNSRQSSDMTMLARYSDFLFWLRKKQLAATGQHHDRQSMWRWWSCTHATYRNAAPRDLKLITGSFDSAAFKYCSGQLGILAIGCNEYAAIVL